MKLFSALFLLALIPASANAATFTFNNYIGEISGLTAGVSKAIVVVDTSGDGFAGINDPNTNNVSHFDLSNFALTAGSVVGDDLVLSMTAASDFGGGQLGFDFAAQTYDTDNALWGGLLGTNQRFAVYWFPTGMNNVSDPFGFYRTDATEEGTSGYFTPTTGLGTVGTLTPSQGGTTSPSAISANNGTISAVPEPSRMVLTLLGVLGLMLRRRR